MHALEKGKRHEYYPNMARTQCFQKPNLINLGDGKSRPESDGPPHFNELILTIPAFDYSHLLALNSRSTSRRRARSTSTRRPV